MPSVSRRSHSDGKYTRHRLHTLFGHRDFLAKGEPIEEAVSQAKRYITGAIRAAATDSVGSGHGPVHHFWNYGQDWGRLP